MTPVVELNRVQRLVGRSMTQPQVLYAATPAPLVFPSREGRPPRRPPQYQAPPQSLSGLLSPVSYLRFQSQSRRASPP